MKKQDTSDGNKRWLSVVNALSDLATEAGVPTAKQYSGDIDEIDVFCERLKHFRGTIEGQMYQNIR